MIPISSLKEDSFVHSPVAEVKGKLRVGFEVQLHHSLAVGMSLSLSFLICKMGEEQSPPGGMQWGKNSQSEFPVTCPSLSLG